MDEEPAVTCSECDVQFDISYKQQWIGQIPEFCPFCGAEIDYGECIKDTE